MRNLGTVRFQVQSSFLVPFSARPLRSTQYVGDRLCFAGYTVVAQAEVVAASFSIMNTTLAIKSDTSNFVELRDRRNFYCIFYSKVDF